MSTRTKVKQELMSMATLVATSLVLISVSVLAGVPDWMIAAVVMPAGMVALCAAVFLRTRAVERRAAAARLDTASFERAAETARIAADVAERRLDETRAMRRLINQINSGDLDIAEIPSGYEHELAELSVYGYATGIPLLGDVAYQFSEVIRRSR